MFPFGQIGFFFININQAGKKLEDVYFLKAKREGFAATPEQSALAVNLPQLVSGAGSPLPK